MPEISSDTYPGNEFCECGSQMDFINIVSGFYRFECSECGSVHERLEAITILDTKNGNGFVPIEQVE